MATDDDVLQVQRDLGRLEGTVEAQGARIDELSVKMDAHAQTTAEKLDRIIATQEQQRGAKRLATWLAGLSGGGVVAAIVEFLKRSP